MAVVPSVGRAGRDRGVGPVEDLRAGDDGSAVFAASGCGLGMCTRRLNGAFCLYTAVHRTGGGMYWTACFRQKWGGNGSSGRRMLDWHVPC